MTLTDADHTAHSDWKIVAPCGTPRYRTSSADGLSAIGFSRRLEW